MSLPRCLRDTVPILESKDVATAILCTAMAGLRGLVIDFIPVVVGEFLTCFDIPDRYNPDDTPELFGVAVGLTRMIDIRPMVIPDPADSLEAHTEPPCLHRHPPQF